MQHPWLAPDGKEWGRKRYIRPAMVHVRLEPRLPEHLAYLKTTTMHRAVRKLLRNTPRWL